MTSASRTRPTSPQASLFDDAALVSSKSPADTSAAPPTLEAQFAALPATWRAHLKPFIDSDTYAPLCRFVDGERAAGKTIYPADVFRALRLTTPR